MTIVPTHPIIPDRFIPRFCDQCASPIRDRIETDDWNQYVCAANPLHSRWIQSPHAACVILLDEFGYTYIVERGIPPAVGGWCFPGGYEDYGDTAEWTIVHEAFDEARARIRGKKAIYLGQWFEEGPGVIVTGLLVHILRADMDAFIKSKEATRILRVRFRTMDPNTLAFNGNRLMLAAAREIIPIQREVL